MHRKSLRFLGIIIIYIIYTRLKVVCIRYRKQCKGRNARNDFEWNVGNVNSICTRYASLNYKSAQLLHVGLVFVNNRFNVILIWQEMHQIFIIWDTIYTYVQSTSQETRQEYNMYITRFIESSTTTSNNEQQQATTSNKKQFLMYFRIFLA